MISDSHVHTSFSSDSDTDPELQIRQAVRLGMKQLTFTDHYDLDFPPGELTFLFDGDAYFARMQALKEQYRDVIDIGIGVELGLQPHLLKEVPAFAAAYPFDFIIGSTHVSRHIDPYEQEQFLAGISEEEAYRIYFEEELENLSRFDCYDIAGHLDYVVRYGYTRNRFFTWEKYGDVLDAILQVLIRKDKGFECNTAGLRAGLGWPHPMPDIWRRYRELGGELLTIGSDAHTPEDLGADFETASEYLKSFGFRSYAVYRNRQPECYPL